MIENSRKVAICFVERFFHSVFLLHFLSFYLYSAGNIMIFNLFIYGVTGVVFDDLLNGCVEATSRNEGMSGSYTLSGVT